MALSEKNDLKGLQLQKLTDTSKYDQQESTAQKCYFLHESWAGKKPNAEIANCINTNSKGITNCSFHLFCNTLRIC